ncbi:ankyrin repeat protein [Pandoravirus inopinatum]|uniref:Ankyrin repeat protein n=1 Tax=Pandoravirus inopinatum TaxID=1605721 RepID=A0A0B5J9D8_9VIRU|nr:ankyrin repeat protein [Pandoravirus inopinatum]AJF97486.1 ankyrin repeat protein [Pandoravirus inopinatum]
MEATASIENINRALPVELLSIILNEHLDRNYDSVCAESVCRLWADLLADTRLCRERVGRWFVNRAALNGHPGVLKWAHAKGCPWDGRTCYGAAAGGHLVVLQWARAMDVHGTR